MVAGSLKYDTQIDIGGFKKGINDIGKQVSSSGTKMRNIIGALGITKLIGQAVSTINASVEDAVKRVDTLNNYPKVMSNLGISAEASTKSINKLSKQLQGLPTTLDSGAMAVQRFTSANGDIDKSTDLFLALNNAILAGGASMDIQATALEQISQAYAKGKPDMMEWRALQTAMPAQLKQIAEAMGTTSAELGEGLRQGWIDMDEFMNTVLKLNKKGIGSYKSFEKQARNSVDGIGTSTKNMKTAIVRGVGNIISSFDKLLKKNGLGGVSNVISGIGKTAEKVLSKVGKGIENLNIPALIKVMKDLLPIIGAVVSAFIGYEIALKAIQAINVIKNITSTASAFISLIPSITSTKDAMALLNVTFSANPIGLVIAGISALAGVLVMSQTVFAEELSQVEKNNNALNNYKNEMNDIAKAKDEYIKANSGEINNYQNLANELNNLVDKNGKVKKGYEERAKFIAETLSEALGIEIELNNGVIKGYEKINGAINDVIRQKRAKIILDAHEQEYNKAIEKEAELQKILTSALNEQKEAQKELNKWTKDVAQQYGLTEKELMDLLNTQNIFNSELPISGQELANLQGKFNGLRGSVNNANKSLQESQRVYDENQLKIVDYEIALQGFSNKNYEIVNKIYNDTINFQGKTNRETYDKYEESIVTMEQYLARLKDNRTKYNEEEYKALKSSGESKLKELKEQQAKYKTAIDEGGKKTVEATAKITADELLAMQGKTIEFKKTAEGHIQAYVDGVKYKKPLAEKDAQKLGQDIAKKIDNAKSDSKKAGENIIVGLQQGIENKNLRNNAFSSIMNFGSSLLTKLKNALKEKSPSRATREMGQYLIEGLTLGVDDEKGNALKSVDNFGNEVLSKMQKAVNLQTGMMSFSGTTGSVSQILSANSVIQVENYNTLELDGEVVYENQQQVQQRKDLQYSFGGGTSK